MSEVRQCMVQDCKNPLWAQNPLFAILCGHYICRICAVLMADQNQEKKGWIQHSCKLSDTPQEFDFNLQDENHKLQAEFHLISKVQKPGVKGKLFTCMDHDDAEVNRFCKNEQTFICVECIEDHYKCNPKENVLKLTQDQIKEKLKVIVDKVNPQGEEQTQYVEEINEILDSQKKANKNELNEIFKKFNEKYNAEENKQVEEINKQISEKEEEIKQLENSNKELLEQKEALEVKGKEQKKKLKQLEEEFQEAEDNFKEQQKAVNELQLQKQNLKYGEIIEEFKKDPNIDKTISRSLKTNGPVSVLEIFENLKEEIEFDEESHHFGEIEVVEYKRPDNHDQADLIAGKFKYIGMINKKSNKPSGLGRLIQNIKGTKYIQEGIFVDGKRFGLIRILSSDEYMYKATFEDDSITRLQTYDSKGKLKQNAFYKEGDQDGKCTHYFDGKIQHEDEYKDAKRQKSTFYDKAGQIISELEVRKGQPYQGEEIEYDDDDGEIIKRTKYVNGKKVV